MVADDMKKANILKTIIKSGKRYITLEVFRKDNHKVKQYGPGGLDYCPPVDIEALVAAINNNRADSSVIAYRDKIVQISESGELRLYGTSEDGLTLLGNIHFKNDGTVELSVPETFTAQAKNTVINGTDGVISTTPIFTINGNLQVNGTIDATDIITSDTDVLSGTISEKTHVHAAGTPPGNTGTPV